MVCSCVETLNHQLAMHNTLLSLTIVFGRSVSAYPTIMTEQAAKGRGQPKAKAVLPTFCPFCGTQYEKPGAAEAAPVLPKSSSPAPEAGGPGKPHRQDAATSAVPDAGAPDAVLTSTGD